MKRIISLLLTAVLTITLFTACTGGNTISTGLGVIISTENTIAPKNNNDGTAQFDNVVAVVTLDSDNKIVKLNIDAPQTRVTFNRKGEITSGISSLIQSKREKGDGYGMKASSGIGKEWHEQITAFEDWAIGKTIDEVIGLKTKKVDATRPYVPDIPELTSSVTITVGDYLNALKKAVANAKPIRTNGTFKTGQGIITRVSNSKGATPDAEGCAQADSMIAVVTVNSKGKVISCTIDTAQAIVAITATGEVTTDLTAETKTLMEQGGDYSSQMADFADWTIGKTIKEIKETKPPTVNIDVSDFIMAIEKAVINAK